MRPVCVGCKVGFRPEKNGVYALQTTEDGPYKVWHADLWACPICGTQLIEGFGLKALKTRHEDGFDGYAKDCEYEFSE